MIKYIVLLRGVNVGGKNKVSMLKLKELFEQNGHQDVITYINSGNIFFSSDITNEKKLKEEFEAIIVNEFQLNIPVMIITANDLLSAFDHAPSWWGQDKDSTHNAIFIIPPATFLDVYKEVGEINPAYEKIDHYGNVVFWSAPIKTYSRTRWSKLVSSSLYDSITIRNINTFRKISRLAKQCLEQNECIEI